MRGEHFSGGAFGDTPMAQHFGIVLTSFASDAVVGLLDHA